MVKKTKKNNRKLKLRIAVLTEEAAAYATQLADANWVDKCNEIAQKMNSRGM